MAIVIAGLTGPIFGTTDESWLYVHNMQYSPTREKAELKNGQSDFVQAVWHSPKEEITFSGRIKTFAGAPTKVDIGTTFTIADGEFAGDYYIDTISETKAEGEWMSFEATATRYDTFTTT